MSAKILSKAFWNYYANCYDAIAQLLPYQQMMADVVSALNIHDSMKILIAGCGTGNLEQYIRHSGIKCEIVAIDFSETMLSIAKNKNPEVEYLWADMTEAFPFESCSFDRVVSVNVLYTLPQVKFSLKEMNRILKQEGQMVHATPKDSLNLLSIFKQHLKNADKAGKLKVFSILGKLIMVYLLNLIILRVKDAGKYRFFSKDDIDLYFDKLAVISDTYASQDWLTKTNKG